MAGGILMTMHRMSQGGADRVAILLANGFVEAGIETDFVLLRDGGEGEAVLTAMLDPRVRLHIAGTPMRSRHLELVRGRAFICRKVAEVQPAVVLASSSNMGLVTGLAMRGRGRSGPGLAMKLTNPVFRPQDRGSLRTRYRRALYRFIFGHYDQVMILTEAERAALSRTYPGLAKHMVTVPNAYIDAAMRPEPRAANAAPQLLTLARMMPQKRLDLMLDAFARVERRDARLTILGDGPLRPMLEQRVAALGIADRVAMPGFVADVLPALRKADLFLLSSDYEGLPAAALEALACGVPVVTTDCFAGARELLGGVAGCAVTPVGDTPALAQAIDRSLAQPRNAEALAAIALPYRIDASIAAHIAALGPLIAGGQ